MALETCGEITSRRIDLAFRICHDLVKEYGMPKNNIDSYSFLASEPGVWAVHPALLDGKDAVEIRIVVG